MSEREYYAARRSPHGSGARTVRCSASPRETMYQYVSNQKSRPSMRDANLLPQTRARDAHASPDATAQMRPAPALAADAPPAPTSPRDTRSATFASPAPARPAPSRAYPQHHFLTNIALTFQYNARVSGQKLRTLDKSSNCKNSCHREKCALLSPQLWQRRDSSSGTACV